MVGEPTMDPRGLAGTQLGARTWTAFHGELRLGFPPNRQRSFRLSRAKEDQITRRLYPDNRAMQPSARERRGIPRTHCFR